MFLSLNFLSDFLNLNRFLICCLFVYYFLSSLSLPMFSISFLVSLSLFRINFSLGSFCSIFLSVSLLLDAGKKIVCFPLFRQFRLEWLFYLVRMDVVNFNLILLFRPPFLQHFFGQTIKKFQKLF